MRTEGKGRLEISQGHDWELKLESSFLWRFATNRSISSFIYFITTFNTRFWTTSMNSINPYVPQSETYTILFTTNIQIILKDP